MKKSLLIAGMLALTLHLGTSPAMAEADEDEDYIIHNKTGETITEIHLAEAGDDDYGDDELDEDLEDGESNEISWDPEDDKCEYDLHIKTADGDEFTVEGYDFCEENDITLVMDGDDMVADDDADGDDDDDEDDE